MAIGGPRGGRKYTCYETCGRRIDNQNMIYNLQTVDLWVSAREVLY